MVLKNLSLFWKMFIPMLFVFTLVMLVLLWFIPTSTRANAEQEAINMAQSTVQQYKQLRSYYTKNIVKKVLAGSELKPSIEHADNPNAIPLPATMIHDLSAAMGQGNVSLSLYSDFPFPNRSSRKLDSFQQAAWQNLSNADNQFYSASSELDGLPVVRVAVPDRMSSQVCVACHNSRADTPKNNWKLGDLRGVLEVVVPIQSQLAAGSAMAYNIIAVLLGAFIIVGLVLALVFKRTVRDKLLSFNKTITLIASGDLEKRVEEDGQDEIAVTGKVINGFVTKLQLAIKEINTSMSALAQGDLRKRVEVELEGDLDSLKIATNNSLDSVEQAMNALSTVTAALVEGDFAQRMQGDFSGEFQIIQGSVNDSMAELERAMNEINRVMTQIANNNLSDRITVELKGDLEVLKQAVNQTVTELGRSLTQIAANANQVAAASGETSTAIGQISDGAQNQLHAMSQVATALTQSGQAVSEVASDAAQASLGSQQSVDLVSGGQEKVAQMVDVVNVIAQNSTKINKITEVIGSIANQTNMLSLNAAIEAARAGEHGAGFAVVAEEVRKLAEHSANSAQEITALVDEAVREAGNAVSTANEVSDDMAAILKSSGDIDDMLRRVASAMEQQSATTQEITSNVDSMKRVAENNAAASEEITATVIEVSRLADGVREQVSNFQLEGEQNANVLLGNQAKSLEQEDRRAAPSGQTLDPHWERRHN